MWNESLVSEFMKPPVRTRIYIYLLLTLYSLYTSVFVQWYIFVNLLYFYGFGSWKKLISVNARFELDDWSPPPILLCGSYPSIIPLTPRSFRFLFFLQGWIGKKRKKHSLPSTTLYFVLLFYLFSKNSNNY